jgi:hypothetical protein
MPHTALTTPEHRGRRSTRALVQVGADTGNAGGSGVSYADGVTIGGVGADGSVDWIRFRLPLRTRLIQLAMLPPSFLLGRLLFLVVSPEQASSFQIGRDILLPLLAGLVGGAAALLAKPTGVTLTPAALVVHRAARAPLSVPWGRIGGLTLRQALGSTQIVVHRSDARSLRLQAPVGGFLGDPAFDRKYRTISTWWESCRSRPPA